MENQQPESSQYSLLERHGNFSDFARRVGASSLQSARDAMEEELSIYRNRVLGATVADLV